MKHEGGYFTLKQPLIRESSFKHTSDVDDAVSPAILDAVNAVQRTPWKVNRFVLGVMQQAYQTGDTIGDIPLADDIPLPPRLPDAAWKALSKDDKAKHKAVLANIHSKNAYAIAKRNALLRVLDVGHRLQDVEALYFPHNIDFRGRLYPLPQDLNPQADDIGKSLLMFAEGKTVDDRGLWWLAIGLANAFGKDKDTLKDRFDWAMENRAHLEECVRDPLGGSRFWTNADEPWMALALAHDFVGALYSDGFKSHVPVSLDGSCNGLQHLAAWGLDPVGAKATNLLDRDVREDIYLEVARVVVRLVEREAADNPIARHWLGKVDRKTVKRAVMTTPYGVTRAGIAIQLVNDGAVDELEGSRQENANYLRDKIVQALEETVVSAKQIMGYIQKCALVLAKADRPMRWTTPAGLTCEQAYWNKTEKTVYTLIGKAIIHVDNKDAGLNSKKQVLASAPNVIHSYDAAHLVLTVNECARYTPLTSMTFVHDSYGTHARDVDHLRDALRRTFVGMYQENPLSGFANRLQADHPGLVFPPLPDRGTLDLTEVLRSSYFFA